MSGDTEETWLQIRKTEGELMETMLEFFAETFPPEYAPAAWAVYLGWPDNVPDPEDIEESEWMFLLWLFGKWSPRGSNDDMDGEEVSEEILGLTFLKSDLFELTEFEREYVQTLVASQFSFYRVDQVEQGEALHLCNLLTDETVRVRENTASKSLEPGQILYTSVLTMAGESLMMGCAPFVFPAEYEADAEELREELEKKLHPDDDLLTDYEFEIREVYWALRAYLLDSMGSQRSPAPMEIRNTDGEELESQVLLFDLKCSPAQAFKKLSVLAEGEDPEELRTMGTFDKQGRITRIDFPWLKSGNAQNPGWSNTVMGSIEIDKKKLLISVMSRERAELAKVKVAELLGEQAVFKLARLQSLEAGLAEAEARGGGPAGMSQEELLEQPEVQEKLLEMNKRRWEGWLDEELPALSGKTPRQAAKSAKGREELGVLLESFEERFSGENDPFGPDVEALRGALGV